MWRNDSLERGSEFLVWLIIPALVSGIGSFIVQAIWNQIGAGIFGFRVATFWEIAGFLYITCTLINAWISREALLKNLKGWWGWARWKHGLLAATLIFLLRLVLVLVALTVLAVTLVGAWNWVIPKLRPITLQGALIFLLIAALPYLLSLDWLDLGKNTWRRLRRGLKWIVGRG